MTSHRETGQQPGVCRDCLGSKVYFVSIHGGERWVSCGTCNGTGQQRLAMLAPLSELDAALVELASPEFMRNYRAMEARLDALEWQPIETAPEVKGDYFFCLVAYGPEGDQSTGYAIRWNGRWFTSGVFHVIGADRRFEIREIEVFPTRWMPLPELPAYHNLAPAAEGDGGE